MSARFLSDGRHLLQHLALVGLRLLAFGEFAAMLLAELTDLLAQRDRRGLRLGEIGLEQRLLLRLGMPDREHLSLVAGPQEVEVLAARPAPPDDETGDRADRQTDEKNDNQLHVAQPCRARPTKSETTRAAGSIRLDRVGIWLDPSFPVN